MLSTLGGGTCFSPDSPPALPPSETSSSAALTPPWRKGTGEVVEEEVGRMGFP